jgi:hypothetical protein
VVQRVNRAQLAIDLSRIQRGKVDPANFGRAENLAREHLSKAQEYEKDLLENAQELLDAGELYQDCAETRCVPGPMDVMTRTTVDERTTQLFDRWRDMKKLAAQQDVHRGFDADSARRLRAISELERASFRDADGATLRMLVEKVLDDAACSEKEFQHWRDKSVKCCGCGHEKSLLLRLRGAEEAHKKVNQASVELTRHTRVNACIAKWGAEKCRASLKWLESLMRSSLCGRKRSVRRPKVGLKVCTL